ncbi:hypothetical protein DMUE_4819 [Dictyocoela muelleri]|nr:hypothetical protein DMUE_4819 [Dictyocoela muelleri]
MRFNNRRLFNNIAMIVLLFLPIMITFDFIDRPIIMTMSMMPLYKLVFENNIPYLKNNPIHLDDTKQAVIIEKLNNYYLIRVDNFYLSKKLDLTDNINKVLRFKIEDSPMGYKLIVDDLCLSRGIGGELLLDTCYDDNSHKNVTQRFEFIKMNVKIALNKDINENSMEKLFRNTAIDNVLKKQLYNLYIETN